MKTFCKSIIALAVIGLVGYTAGGFVGVPYFAKKMIAEKVPELSPGATASIKDVSFNPFTFDTKVEGLQVSNFVVGDAKVTLSIQKFTAGVSSLSLFGKSVAVSPVTIETPFIQYSQDLSAKKSAPKKVTTAKDSAVSTSEDSGWKWSVESLNVKNGKFTLQDTGFKKPESLTVEAINLLVKNISSSWNKTPFTLTAKPLDGSLNASGDFTGLLTNANISTSVSDINLAKVSPWVNRASGMDLKDGKLELSANGAYNKGAASGIVNAKATSFTVAKAGIPFLSAKSITVKSAKLRSLDPLTFAIENLNADFGIVDSKAVDEKVTNAVGDILAAFGHKKVAQKVKENNLGGVSISNVTYKNGNFSSTSKGVGYTLLNQLNTIFGSNKTKK